MNKYFGIALLAAVCPLRPAAQVPAETAPTLHVKKFVAPAYPVLARYGRIQGTTTTDLQVRADGTVESVKVTMAHPVFHSYVQKALRQWLFESSARSATLTVTVKFSLSDCIGHESSAETLVQADLPSAVEVTTCLAPITVTNN
jgi:TonB family protein